MQAATASTFIDVFRPRRAAAGLTYDLVLVVFGSAVIALSARLWISLPLAITPVPITGQTLAILLVGALDGSKRGPATVLLYLAEGAAGLPVFVGGSGGALHLLGPTGGYLVGFVLGAFVTGVLSERGWDRRWAMTALAMTLGTIALFVPGLIWLAFFVGPNNVLIAGLWPFLPGAVIKIALATALLPQGWKVLYWLDGREFAAARRRR